VFVSDDFALSAELMIRRKHTLSDVAHFSNDIPNAVMQLNTFKETDRIAVMVETPVADERGESLIPRAAVERVIISYL
jgi:hypothetical protein